MEFIATQALTGLAGASALFLVASGLTVIFGVTRVVNFAHGSLFMLGAYIAWSILTRLPRDPAWFAAGVLGAALATAALGVAMETLVLRRLYRAPELLQLLATFAVLLMVQDATLAIWGPEDLPLPRPPWMRGFVLVLDTRFPLYDLVLIAAGPLVLGALWLLFARTRWGTLVRAATEDRDMVAALGINQRLLFATVFALGAGLAGLGGALALPASSANLGMDLAIITDAFVVVVLGGMGSLPGAFLAALMIGELQAFGIVLMPRATMVLAFALMAVVLMVRPHGLLGRKSVGERAEALGVAFIRPARAGFAWLVLAILAVAALLPLVVGPFLLGLLTEALIAILFAVSLHVVLGPGGMHSFGHAAWFGIGAYAAALAARDFAAPMPLALALAPIMAGLVAAAVGAFIVRLAGIYLAMLTLAFAQIVWAIAMQWDGLTGGDNGVLGVWPQGWARAPEHFYWLALALCAACVLMLRRVLFAPFGYALRATRDSPLRAAAIGLPVTRIRHAAFALSGAAAGLAGGLAAYSKGSVFPTYAAIAHSVDALLMVLLGGIQTVSGPVLGALAYTGLSVELPRATSLWRFWLGLIILVLVMVFPRGIAGMRRAA